MMEEATQDDLHYENTFNWDNFQNIDAGGNDEKEPGKFSSQDSSESDQQSSLSFDDLPWEVECTEEVWKSLTNNKMDQILRKKILERVHRIATGEWPMYLARRVKARNRRKFNTVRYIKR